MNKKGQVCTSTEQCQYCELDRAANKVRAGEKIISNCLGPARDQLTVDP